MQSAKRIQQNDNTCRVADCKEYTNAYYARLAGAGAMWPEMQTLLGHTIPSASLQDIRTLIVDRNILSKRTLSNRIEVWKKLKARYTLDQSSPIFQSFLAAYHAEPSEAQRALLGYLLMCANDDLVKRLGLDWLLPRMSRPGTPLNSDDVTAFLSDLSRQAPEVGQWTETTRIRFVRHYLGAVRDYGLAVGMKQKRTTRFHAGSRVLIFALRLGMRQRLKPLELLRSDWMHLLGIDFDSAITRMYQLNAEGLARFRMAGDVVDLTLPSEAEVRA